MFRPTPHGPLTRIRMASTVLGRPVYEVSAYAFADLPSEFTATIAARKPPHGAPGALPVTSLEAVEREAIIAAILSADGNLTQVAHDLHIAKSTLYLRIKKFELDHVLRTVKLSGP